jgi:phosphate transport system substrate-binding protein
MRLASCLLAAGLVLLAGCAGVPPGQLTGEIKVDGSSTVYLITEAMATQFKQQHPYVNISVGISGTGGGFKKFAAGETDISDASRRIKDAERDACKKNGIDFLEFQVAWDGLTVIIHPENYWARAMTVEQLRKIWHPNTAAKNWSDVDPTWPDQDISLFGAGPDSGTFDYFTEVINGKERLSRRDYQASENDNVTAQGVAGNRYALGYFGLAYYEENKDKVAAIAVAAKAGAPFVAPSRETVLNQTYKPLSRPLFIYVKKASLRRPEVEKFVRFYLRRNDLVVLSGYIDLNVRGRMEQQAKLEAAIH